MLTTARVAIPAPIEAQLKTAADYSDNVNDYARDDLIGFNRPMAAAFALVAPLALALTYKASGMTAALQWGALLSAVAVAGLVVVGKQEWPKVVAKFQYCATAKRKAIADLRCGFGEASYISNGRAPSFFEHDHGVLVLADAGDLKTLFFTISNDGTDPRWELYQKGDMERRVWRWLRLPVSREVVKFTAEGSKMAGSGDALVITSIEAWEAINVVMGEPLDGAVIHRPFSELVETVERAL